MSWLLVLLLGVAHADAPWADRLASIDTQLLASPDDIDLKIARAELLRRAGQLDEAQASLDGVDHDAARLERARIEAARGDAKAALTHLDGLELRAASILRAELLTDSAPVDALAAYDAALGLRPDPDLHLRRARIAHGLKRADTLDVLAAGIDELGGAVVLRLERMKLAMASNEPMVAFLEATILLGQDPGRPDWLLGQADALEAMGHDVKATRNAALITARQRLDRRNTALNRLALARALEANGRNTEARDIARSLDQDLPGVRDLLASLETP
jgi:tetratricopeptide (TPR) repeat protein